MEARVVLSGLSLANPDYWYQGKVENGLAIKGTVESGDEFGWAVATGDFDDDGNEDLAIGVRGESGGTGAGAVNVIYGSDNRLKPGSTNDTVVNNQLWTGADLSVPGGVQAGAHVGAALATGDFNGDGVDDLAIGIPDADIGSTSGAGGVAVLYGKEGDGLTSQNSQFWELDDIVGESNAAEAHFGMSLAAGNFDNDDADDLAIGVPDDQIGGDAGAGGVAVIYGERNTGLSSDDSLYLNRDYVDGNGDEIDGNAMVNDHFGASLAVGKFNDDAFDDLAIGVPDDDVDSNSVLDAGAVNVVYGSGAGLTAKDNQFLRDDQPKQDAGYGTALVAGKFNRDAIDDLAIGIPGETVNGVQNAGAVNILDGSDNGFTGAFRRFDQNSRQGDQSSPRIEAGGAENNDRFGAALTSGDFKDDDDLDELVIGAPGETLDGPTSVGVVTMLVGTSEGLTATGSETWRPRDLGLTEHANERFGHSLATGNFDKEAESLNVDLPDLAIGIPGDIPVSAAGGAVAVLYGTTGPSTGSPTVTIDQATGKLDPVVVQPDPTALEPIFFEVQFSEAVTGFEPDTDPNDISFSSSTPAGTTVDRVRQISPSSYIVEIGMTNFGTVTPSIPAGAAVAADDGKPSLVSTSQDNEVSYQQVGNVTATITARIQTSSEIIFDVVFSEAVTGFCPQFDNCKVQIGGTAFSASSNPRHTGSPTGSSTSFEIRVSGMDQTGTVILTVSDNAVTPANEGASGTGSYTLPALTVTITPQPSQNGTGTPNDPILGQEVTFDATFSLPVTGFDNADVKVNGTAQPQSVDVQPTDVQPPGAQAYTITLGGMANTSGTVFVVIREDAACAGNDCNLETVGDLVNFQALPTVTIRSADDQEDPTDSTEVRYVVEFSEPVTGFECPDPANNCDITISGTAFPVGTTPTVTVNSVGNVGSEFIVQISGMAVPSAGQQLTVAASIPANVVDQMNAASASIDLMIVPPPAGWTNDVDPFDVNNDGAVTSLDVLQIINVVNDLGVNPNPNIDANGQLLAPSAAPRNYLDVNQDGFVSPRDALAVILDINQRTQNPPPPPADSTMALAAIQNEDEEEEDERVGSG